MPDEKLDRDGEAFDKFNEAVEALYETLASETAKPMDFQRAVQECQYRCGVWLGSLPASARGE